MGLHPKKLFLFLAWIFFPLRSKNCIQPGSFILRKLPESWLVPALHRPLLAFITAEWQTLQGAFEQALWDFSPALLKTLDFCVSIQNLHHVNHLTHSL